MQARTALKGRECVPDAEISKAVWEATKLLRDHWAAVETVAKRPLVYGELEGAEVRRVVTASRARDPVPSAHERRASSSQPMRPNGRER
jgi:hypothetical protein